MKIRLNERLIRVKNSSYINNEKRLPIKAFHHCRIKAFVN